MMRSGTTLRAACCVVIATICAGASGTGRAADAVQGNQPTAQDNSGTLDEIIVTARKREESILNVPVIETAIPQAELQTRQTVEITDLPNIVPGLMLGRGLLTIGDFVSIRGVGTSATDQGVDPSIALN